ncbi:hypothetical protein HK100_007443 [Physocladia obscura]|uniref:Cytochrome P450 n=1 Tax=Physocladia obscura TaxID=109957 RepID=A0AAD5XIP7_9FUNG|nr:hypothetical protein HK100_007443 [Physocladia obscura]
MSLAGIKALHARGETVWLRLPVFGRFLAAVGPHVAREVLTMPQTIAYVGSERMAEFFGPSTIGGKTGNEHRRIRALSAKAVSKSALKFYFDDIKQLAIETMQIIASQSSPAGIYQLEYFQKFVYNSICSFMVASTTVHGQQIKDLRHHYHNFAASVMVFPFPRWIVSRTVKKGLDSKKVIVDTITRIVRERRAAIEAGEIHNDALSAFIDSTDADGNSLTDKEIADLFLVMLMAGFETTAKQLTTLFYHLTHCLAHEDFLRLQQEVSQPNALDSEQSLSSLPILDAFVKESMRLLPVGRNFYLITIADATLQGKTVKKGTVIFPFIDYSTFNVDDEPSAFKLSRFLGENAFDKTNPTQYTPFGYGPRQCLGLHLARMEMKVLLAVAISSYNIVKVGHKARISHFPSQYAQCKVTIDKKTETPK